MPEFPNNSNNTVLQVLVFLLIFSMSSHSVQYNTSGRERTTSDTWHWRQLLFKMWLKRLQMARLGIVSEHSSTASSAIAALTHARVIAQSAVLQVRMQERVSCRYASLLPTQNSHVHNWVGE